MNASRREIEDFRDVSPPVGDLEDLRAISRATALGASHNHIGQELHVHCEEAVSLAGAAPPALDVEAEEARAIVPQLGLVGRGVGPPDLVEGLQVSDGVGSTRPADRGLIQEDRVLELAGSLELVEGGDGQRLLMQPLAERGVERLLDQGALASTADAGDDAQNPQRESHVNRLQIVAPGAPESQKSLGRCTPGRGNLHALAAREEIAGERSLDLGERADRSGVEQMAPRLARAGTKIYQVIGRANQVMLMLDDHQGIAGVAQAVEYRDQASHLVLVQADRWLVEDVECVDQTGSQGPGHRRPPQFTAGERAARSVERQVVEPDLAEVIETLIDLVENPRGHLAALLGRPVRHELTGVADRQGRQLGDVDAANANG